MINQAWFARSGTSDSLCCPTTAQLLFSSSESGITVQMDISQSEEIQNGSVAHLQVYFHLKISYFVLNNLLLKKLLIPVTNFSLRLNKCNTVQSI